MHPTRHVRAAVSGAALSAVVVLGMAGAAYAQESEDPPPQPSCGSFSAVSDPAQRDEAIKQTYAALDPEFRTLLDTNEDDTPCGAGDEGVTWLEDETGDDKTDDGHGSGEDEGDDEGDDGGQATADPQAGAKDRDCADFATQADAQAALDADESDPERLDADDDGIACEDHFETEDDQVAVKPKGGVATGGYGL